MLKILSKMLKSVILLLPVLSTFCYDVNSDEILVPERVTFDGKFISYSLNHELQNKRIRHLRSIDDNETKQNSHNIYYSLNSNKFGKLLLSLSPNKRLLAPAFVIEKWSNRTSNYNQTHPFITHSFSSKINKFCYFEGIIHNITNSLVSLSTCDGLRGLIRFDGQDLFIEPIGSNIRDANPNPHKISKRSIKFKDKFQTSLENEEGVCGNSEDFKLGIRQREIWEQKRKNNHKKRTKRSVSVERNVETLVVADQMMVDYYTNEDLEMYILTVMNVVSTLYHDASIGNAINIVMVKVILLEDQMENAKFPSSSRANVTLKNFCRWQKHINPKEDHHPEHHDAAVLITRNNICSAKNDRTCNSLGLAEIAGMCQPLRSCAIAEDTGLSLAYTIAHEIGHNFGMSHDGPHNGCLTPLGEKHHIMSPSLNSESSPVVWSNCSRTEITKFLDRDWGYCLDDEPTEHYFPYPDLPPGAMYDADHQCRLQYGPEAEYCHDMQYVNLCETLWCKSKGLCITKLKPAAEGTICDRNKWCFLGKCVEIGERPGAINGEWGQWSEWTQCSRSCGAGIMESNRECNNPKPSYGGRYCIGERKRYKVCNTEPCQSNNQSFRATQCSSFDNIPFKGEIYKWQPVLTPLTPCQLHCKPEGKSFSVMLSDAVIDGTPCQPGTRDMCINGKCRSVSCDWGFDSEAQEDRCGICHGDGTQCLTNRANFTQLNGFGYIEILTVPEGALNFRIEEMFEDPNYLALVDSKGDFILNGDYMIDWTGEYSVSGTTFYYDRDPNGLEKLHAPGPTTDKVKVMILFQGENRGIKWEYTIKDFNASRSPEFEWVYEEYDICSRTCGGGLQISKVRCYEKEAGLVEEKYCLSSSEKPPEKRRICNAHSCPARWWTGPWQHCNASCDQNGVRKRSVLCVRSISSEEQVALRNSECDINIRPDGIETCKHLKPCFTYNATQSFETSNENLIENHSNCTKESEPKLFCMTALNRCNNTAVRAKCCHTCELQSI